jgi:hypothetical protein
LKRLKFIAGVLLITLAIGGLLFWEIKGRDVLLTEEVIVAKVDIQPGERLTQHMLTTMKIPKDHIIEAALSPSERNRLIGKISNQHILKKHQISTRFFMKEKSSLKSTQSIYVIKNEWIFMRSSSLRSGDEVEIINVNKNISLGFYRVAFVKDVSEREVKNVGDEYNHKTEGILSRQDGTSQIDHIEIVATLNQYQEIMNSIQEELSPSLMIVQRSGSID